MKNGFFKWEEKNIYLSWIIVYSSDKDSTYLKKFIHFHEKNLEKTKQFKKRLNTGVEAKLFIIFQNTTLFNGMLNSN